MAKSDVKLKYIYGYDRASGLWIVGLETESGTISKPAESFVETPDAKKRAAELNGEQAP